MTPRQANLLIVATSALVTLLAIAAALILPGSHRDRGGRSWSMVERSR